MSKRKRLILSVVFGVCLGSVWLAGSVRATSDEEHALKGYLTFLRGAAYGVNIASCQLRGELRAMSEAESTQALRLAFAAQADWWNCANLRAIVSQVTSPERTP